MSNPRDAALLLDIANAAERIIAFTRGMDEVAFCEDPRTHLAVQHQIIVIGERRSAFHRSFATTLSKSHGLQSLGCAIV